MIRKQKKNWGQHLVSSRKEGKVERLEPPELIAYGGAELRDRILELMGEVWEERKVVDDWRDAKIVPIPKKEISSLVTIGAVSAFSML